MGFGIHTGTGQASRQISLFNTFICSLNCALFLSCPRLTVFLAAEVGEEEGGEEEQAGGHAAVAAAGEEEGEEEEEHAGGRAAVAAAQSAVRPVPNRGAKV